MPNPVKLQANSLNDRTPFDHKRFARLQSSILNDHLKDVKKSRLLAVPFILAFLALLVVSIIFTMRSHGKNHSMFIGFMVALVISIFLVFFSGLFFFMAHSSSPYAFALETETNGFLYSRIVKLLAEGFDAQRIVVNGHTWSGEINDIGRLLQDYESKQEQFGKELTHLAHSRGIVVNQLNPIHKIFAIPNWSSVKVTGKFEVITRNMEKILIFPCNATKVVRSPDGKSTKTVTVFNGLLVFGDSFLNYPAPIGFKSKKLLINEYGVKPTYDLASEEFRKFVDIVVKVYDGVALNRLFQPRIMERVASYASSRGNFAISSINNHLIGLFEANSDWMNDRPLWIELNTLKHSSYEDFEARMEQEIFALRRLIDMYKIFCN